MDSDRDKPVLADWAKHPGHQIMRQRLTDTRNAYYARLGETLYRTPDLLAATDLREKAAFFKGALWILNNPVFELKALERAQAHEGADTE